MRRRRSCAARIISSKKETARANWIAGVSHDIRTPLSMVLGYASQIEENRNVPKKTGIKRGSSGSRACG
ncbi:MAG: histidine kinase dimerization/phospho-acceptor domain-containing protein [Blautia marasmi]